MAQTKYWCATVEYKGAPDPEFEAWLETYAEDLDGVLVERIYFFEGKARDVIYGFSTEEVANKYKGALAVHSVLGGFEKEFITSVYYDTTPLEERTAQ